MGRLRGAGGGGGGAIAWDRLSLFIYPRISGILNNFTIRSTMAGLLLLKPKIRLREVPHLQLPRTFKQIELYGLPLAM